MKAKPDAKSRSLSFLCATLLVTLPVSADPAGSPAAPAAATSAKVEDLAFLTGCWRAQGTPVIEEHWMRPTGGTLIGMGRVAAEGKTYFFEYLRIETRADGIYYVAQPRGQEPTDFKLVRSGPDEVVFENLAHDFPKRILYRKLADGRLFARTEGDGSEKEKPSEFFYESVDD